MKAGDDEKGTGGGTRHPAVRRASGARYAGGRPVAALGARASESDDTAYRRAASDPDNLSMMGTRRSKVYSIVTLLPVLMLLAGLFSYYRTESVQSHGAPIRARAVSIDGVLEGLSVVRSGGQGRHFLWFDDPDRGRRGARLAPAQARELHELVSPGDALRLDLAPTVEGSSTLWVWRVSRGDEVLLDDSARLR